jgi:hypothetical protein
LRLEEQYVELTRDFDEHTIPDEDVVDTEMVRLRLIKEGARVYAKVDDPPPCDPCRQASSSEWPPIML